MLRTTLSRRALLGKVASAAIGLPLLQAMMPMGRLFAGDPPASPAIIPKRLCVVYVPHGMYMPNFLPTRVGRDFPLSPTLEPLAPFAQRISVISNLKMDMASSLMHRSGELFLTNEKIGEHDNFSPNCLSMDRLIVNKYRDQTLLPSLELSLSPYGGGGLRNTLAYDLHGSPLPGQHDPQAVFELLFGSADEPEAQRAALREERSILDHVTPQVQAIRGQLGKEDQRVLVEYLESIRETESYIQRLEKRVDKPSRPQDQGLVIDGSKVSSRMRNMFDLMFLALRADLTRVITFVVFKERADASQQYPELGLVGEHHGWTHQLADLPAKREETIKILSTVDRFHCDQLAYFLKRLHETPEGDGTMLDHTLVVFGSALSAVPEHIHDPINLPIVLAGGEKLGIRQGQHVHYDTPVNLSNLNLTLLQTMGIDSLQWKDSTGVLSEIRT